MRRPTWCWPQPWAKEPAVRSLQPLEEQAKGRPAAPAVRVDRTAGTWRALLARREVSAAALPVIGSVLFDLTHPSFLTYGNISTILTNVAVVATISIGMTMVIVTGGIDVSIGSMLALCMLMSAKAMVAGADLKLVLLVSLAGGLALGLFNATIAAYGRIHPIIVTLGTLNIFRAL